ncbi:poly-beta-hydroxybutyrate polymerase domain-containing protein [Striga asiatica]|uniref:Poly-beta-hydroxybutyrate polymerase domain-containing protein n=1 Tax=Striga asiatica TaxID=4170 RepID=A0A5A7PKF8_STRAF|nr:poly-beta-hydroxybutyrate polymerase domain-containing protein [Striga asiatica]
MIALLKWSSSFKENKGSRKVLDKKAKRRSMQVVSVCTSCGEEDESIKSNNLLKFQNTMMPEYEVVRAAWKEWGEFALCLLGYLLRWFSLAVLRLLGLSDYTLCKHLAGPIAF